MSRHRRKQGGPRAVPPPLALPLDELGAIVERTKAAALSADDHAKLKAAMDTLVFVTAELQTQADLARPPAPPPLRRDDGEDPHDPRPGRGARRAGPRGEPERRGRPPAPGPRPHRPRRPIPARTP